MTRCYDRNGDERVKLGNFERSVGAFAMAVLLAIGSIVWLDHEAIGTLRTDVAVLQDHVINK